MSATDELLRESERESDEERREAGSRFASIVRFPFSPRAFLLVLLVMVLVSVLAGFVPFVPGGFAALGGVFVGGFTLGLLRGRRSYFEVAIAGAGVAVAATVTQFLLLSVVGDVGVPLAALGGAAGFVAGVVGHYFGRDLRSGLTREL